MKETERMSQDELKKMRRMSYIKMVAMVGIMAAVIAFGSIAWFTMNREVEGSGVQMRADDLPYEIKTVGDNTGFRSHIFTEENNVVTEETRNLLDVAGLNTKYKIGEKINNVGFFTSGGTNDIQFHLDQTQNDIDGLGPDSKGVLTFYLVPKSSSPFTAKFSLHMDGYTAEQTRNEDGTYNVSSMTKIDSSSSEAKKQAVDYLNGHILFFTGRHNVGTAQAPKYSYTGLIENNELTLSFPNSEVTSVTEGQPIEVNIYWTWPNTFGQMVLSESDNTPVAYDTATRTALQNYVVDNYEAVFRVKDGFDPMLLMTKAERDENNQLQIVYDAEKVANPEILDELSLGYNEADQEIGMNINYMLLVLSAGQ